jgi:ATP-binding cassette subfamily B protein
MTPRWLLLKRLLGLTWRYRGACLRVFLLQMLILTLTLGGLNFGTLAVDFMRHVVTPKAPPPAWPFGFSPPPHWPPMQVVAAIAGAVVAFALLRGLLSALYTVGLTDLVQGQVVVNLRADVYRKLQRLSFRFFDANASSTIINRVTGDVQSVRMFIDKVVMESLSIGISAAVFLGYMARVHLGLTIACIATAPMLCFASATFARTTRPAFARSRELYDRMVYRLTETIRGMPVIKAFARDTDEMKRFRESNDQVRDQKQSIFRRVSIFTPTMGFLSQVNIIVLLGYGGALVIRGDLPLGTGLLMFSALLQQLSGQISNAATIANSMQESLIGAERVFEILDAPLEVQTAAGAQRVGRVHGRLQFEKVWFDHGADPVLQNIDFTIEPGRTVALFGPTGSGKSALLSLIPRFYDPTGGRILLDGTDLRSLDLDDLRRNVGLVFQESFLFSTTVAANIAFGNPAASSADVERAARMAAAHDFILKLPKGYATVLGESGVGLSGGQRQRLAIARALLLDPAILILDDPTASVDPGTESEIIDAMGSATAGRTTFVVTHRLSILKRCDEILILDRGRIVQRGTHEQLIQAPGHYADAADVQQGSA